MLGFQSPSPTFVRRALVCFDGRARRRWFVGLCLWAAGGCASDLAGPLPEVVTCDPGSASVLAVGSSQRVRVRRTTELCLRAPSGGAEYVLVAFLGSSSSAASTRFEVRGENLLSVEPFPVSAPFPLGLSERGSEAIRPSILAEVGDVPALPDSRWDADLRRRERSELLPLIQPASARFPEALPPTGVAAAPPAVGSLLRLNAQANKACEDPLYRTGEVIWVSERAVLVADTLNPAGGFTFNDYRSIGASFDTLVGPLIEEHFGQATDIDQNGRIILFFTEAVNRLTASDADQYVGGFFYARDLFPTTSTNRLQGCATSNQGEVLYLMVPDPARAPASIWGRSAVRRATPSTVAHEAQHLVNASRRLHVNLSAKPFEETWLNEGLSHAAEELLFFRASGLSPRANLDAEAIRAGGARAVDAFNSYHLANVFRFEGFLRDPHKNSPYDEEDSLATRGAAQQFLRYAADRSPSPDPEFFRGLTAGPASGLANLGARLGGTDIAQEWLTDWTVAVYADSQVSRLSPNFETPSWNLPKLYESLQISPYPLRIERIPPSGVFAETLVGGGSTHLRFGLRGGTRAVLRMQGGSEALASPLWVTVLRTR